MSRYFMHVQSIKGHGSRVLLFGCGEDAERTSLRYQKRGLITEVIEMELPLGNISATVWALVIRKKRKPRED